MRSPENTQLPENTLNSDDDTELENTHEKTKDVAEFLSKNYRKLSVPTYCVTDSIRKKVGALI